MSREFDAVAHGVERAFSHAAMLAHEQLYALGCDWSRPSVLFRPRVYPDGNEWCALYGDNLQDGVCGFGASPELAARAFDKAWYAKTGEGADEA